MRGILAILCFIIFLKVESSTKIIEGTVADMDSSPIEAANIAAFLNDSLVGGTISDTTGFFRLSVSVGCDSLKISFMGYDDYMTSTIQPDMGVIILKRNHMALKEVVVSAPLIKREADRYVLNVAANPLWVNKDAKELLRTAPGVWATDESLSIYGQGGAIVYIDDRKVNLSGSQLMTYLKSIPSSSISHIEIIPKAGAEYSADSSGGLIKIYLKRNRLEGVNGSMGFNVTAGRYKQWLNPFLNLSLHSGKWTFNFNGSVNGCPSERYTNHEESDIILSNQEMKGMAYHEGKTFQSNLSIGLFYEPFARDKIGLQIEYNPEVSKHSSNASTEINRNNSIATTFGEYYSKKRFHNFNASLNWTHTLDENGSELKLLSNYNYQNASVKEDNRMEWAYLTVDSVFKTDNQNLYSIFLTDFSLRKAFNINWNINAGVKFTLNSIENKSFHKFLKVGEWILNKRFDFDNSYSEYIMAMYATANGKIDRWRFKAGIRGEYTMTHGDIAPYKRFDLFPNANIAYNLTDKGDYTVAIGYNRYIQRASFQSLNPVVIQVSDYTYTVGNPSLIPSFTNSLSLDFVLAGKFTIATGYSIITNPIRQMFISNPEFPERLYLTWGKMGKIRNLFVHGDGSLKLTEWWNLYSSVTYVLTSQKLSDSEPIDTLGYLQLVGQTSFLLARDFNFSINIFYSTTMKIGNITVFPILNLNPTLQKRFGSNWTLSVGVENVLQRRNKIKAQSSGYTRLSYSKNYMTAKIGLTYIFSSGEKFRSQKIEKNIDNSRFNRE